MRAVLVLTISLFRLGEPPTQKNCPDPWPVFRGNPAQTGTTESPLPENLAVLWKFKANEAFSGSAAVVDGVAYIGCEDGELRAFDLDSGHVRWSMDAQSPILSTPTVIRDMVIFGNDAGTVQGLTKDKGKPIWSFKTDGQVISSANVFNDRIVFGSYDGFVYCLTAADGRLLWKFETEGKVHGTPAIAENHVIAAGCDEFLHVLNLTDGSQIRKVSLGSVSGSSTAILGSRAFAGTYGNQVRCSDWKTGADGWTFEDDDRQFPFVSSPAVTARCVILGGRDKRLRAFDPVSGRVLWEFVTKGRIDSSSVIVGQRAFFGSSDGNLYGIDVATGRELWRYEAGSPITASPAIGCGRLVIGTQDGDLLCFSGSSGGGSDKTGGK